MATRPDRAAPTSLARVKVSRLEARIRRRLGPALGAPARADEPYASHVPVLVGVAWLRNPRRILELGAGLHSTSTFLDPQLFPSLEYLRSLENDVEWLVRVRTELPHDRRLDLIGIEGQVARAAESVDISGFDLVFIDDSVVAADRVATIAAIAPRLPPSALAIIHDFEVQPYREAALRFDHRLTFDAYEPFTGVCWNGDASPRRTLKRLRREIQRLNGTVPMTDGQAWKRALGERHG